MRDRNLAILFTVLAILLLGCPGLTIFCLGISGFIAFYSNGYPNNNVSPTWVNVFGSFGICAGILLIILTIIAAFFLLRRKTDVRPAKLEEPLPPSAPDEPLPPSS